MGHWLHKLEWEAVQAIFVVTKTPVPSRMYEDLESSNLVDAC